MSFKFSLLIIIILIESTATKSYINSGYSESGHIHHNIGNETIKRETNNQYNVTFNMICQELRSLNETRTRFKRFVFYVQEHQVLVINTYFFSLLENLSSKQFHNANKDNLASVATNYFFIGNMVSNRIEKYLMHNIFIHKTEFT